MKAVKAQDAAQAGYTSLTRLSSSRASVADIQTKLSWLIKRFKDFQSACWWVSL